MDFAHFPSPLLTPGARSPAAFVCAHPPAGPGSPARSASRVGRTRRRSRPPRLPPGLLRSRRPPAQVFREGASGGGGTGTRTGPPAGLAPRRSRDTSGLPRGQAGRAGRHGRLRDSHACPSTGRHSPVPLLRSQPPEPPRDPGPKLLLAKASSLSRHS